MRRAARCRLLVVADGMRIGELAGRLGINPRTVRYYEQIGLIPAAPRTGAGYRQYDEDDAARLGFIKTAQRLGLSLDEVAEILRLRDSGERPCGYVRALLDTQLAVLDRRIAELRALRGELRELQAAADNLPEDAALTCRIIEHARAQAPAAGGSTRR